MMTSSLKSATQTSQQFASSATTTTLRSGTSDRQPNGTANQNGSTGAAKRFLTVLVNSLATWAV